MWGGEVRLLEQQVKITWQEKTWNILALTKMELLMEGLRIGFRVTDWIGCRVTA